MKLCSVSSLSSGDIIQMLSRFVLIVCLFIHSAKVIHRSVSNPILVLSHSTQLKASPKLLPTVTEVIPFRGPEDGGTRVAILGSGFCDSPTVRVKFDQIEVMPIFHGTKTLIVSTPQHKPGTVEVRVCNDLNSWSESAGGMFYPAPLTCQLHLPTMAQPALRPKP